MLWQQTVVWCSPCCIELPNVCTYFSVLILPSHPQLLLHIALFVQPSKYVLNEYQTVRVNCFKNCGWKMFMDTIFRRSKQLLYNTLYVVLSVTRPLSASFIFLVPLHPEKHQ